LPSTAPTEISPADARAFADLALSRRHRPQDDAGMLIEPHAGYRRLDPTRLALEQGRRELRLEVGDMMAERGLRDIGLVGRPRQVALLV